MNQVQILNTVLTAVLPRTCPQAREKLWMALGEAAPVLVPVSHVMMCMNCTTDFSLTLRRHHCNACGKVSPSAPTDATLYHSLLEVIRTKTVP